ncbi:hypothetical protein ACM66B_005782 [Microbotryomycetes sp. NB124-2]
MQLPLGLIRTILYIVFIVCSAFSFIFAAAFVGLTNSRYGYYYESSVELLVTAILALATVPMLHFVLHRQGKPSILTSAVVELSVVAVLWLLYLGGAAAMADALPGLRGSWCDSSVCHVGRALQAFSWLAWIVLSFQLGLLITLLVLNSRSDKSAWRQPFAQSTSTASNSHPNTTGAPETTGMVDKHDQQSFATAHSQTGAGANTAVDNALYSSAPGAQGAEQMGQTYGVPVVQGQHHPYGSQAAV